MAAHRHDSAGGRAVLPARKLDVGSHARHLCRLGVHHCGADRLVRRMAGPPLEPDFGLRRLPGPCRRQADGVRRADRPAGLEPRRRVHLADHHRP
ncbi:hypothetical protein G6F59_018254 [Rhizopus arrhizus]|nr:hypothetical protein G6F23_015810 [Rhizopus arrhizus]KAG1376508.1 hypothetical protein G6F59_018254 [Rhizopus arrhizus]